MDDDDFYIDHHNPRIMFEAMMYAGGFRIQCTQERRYSTSPELSPIRRRSISPESRKGEIDVLPCVRFQGKKLNYKEYNQIAERNAEELIKEEEQAKLKIEKKKAKKERQKQKKKQLAESSSAVNNNDSATDNISNDLEKIGLNPNNKEAEGLDVHAAFVSTAIKKVKCTPIITEEPKAKKEVKDINFMIKKAEEYERSENYKEAIQFYSDAINLDPKRFDLILKRSYIYYQLAKFEKSVRDARKVVQHSPNNVDAHYRLGEAHFALNHLAEADEAFTKLLNLNSHRNEAQKRLFSIRIKQLEEMGYHPNEAFTALLKSKNKTLDEAIQYLTDLETGKVTTEDLYYSDEEESEEDEEEEEEEEEVKSNDSEDKQSASSMVVAKAKPKIVINNSNPLLTDPSNPFHCCSLFVSNLKKDITYKEVHNVFIKFGDLESIKLVTEPNCYAFVNFRESDAAGRAMEALQNSRWLLSTVPLLIKFPTKAVNTAIPNMKNPELILSKLNDLKESKSATGKPNGFRPTFMKQAVTAPSGGVPVVKPPQVGRPRPAAKTEECFYWRTFGCTFGNKCFNLHIPGHEHIDAKGRRPFQT